MNPALFTSALGALGGSSSPSSARGSQDGNQLRSGTGSFSVGGPPPWVWWVAAGVVLFGLFGILRKP